MLDIWQRAPITDAEQRRIDKSLSDPETGVYQYAPSHALAIVFTVLVGLSLVGHLYQNHRYGFGRVMFFMCWGGLIFAAGWGVRAVSSFMPVNLALFIAQYCLIYAGPPIYSAAEYNVLGRLMQYLPQHAPLNPRRVTYFFIYLGVVVEVLTGLGASTMAANQDDRDAILRGGTIMSIALVLQAVVELLFISMVSLIHRRAKAAGMCPPNVSKLCVMLYGTSILIVLRCVFRAIESFSTMGSDECNSVCELVSKNEWYLYVFEAAPMVVYTFWLNAINPGRLLPRETNRFLDADGLTERLGPGWQDHRSTWETMMDPFDIKGLINGTKNHTEFWLERERWPVAPGGAFSMGTASNVKGRRDADFTSKEAPSPA